MLVRSINLRLWLAIPLGLIGGFLLLFLYGKVLRLQAALHNYSDAQNRSAMWPVYHFSAGTAWLIFVISIFFAFPWLILRSADSFEAYMFSLFLVVAFRAAAFRRKMLAQGLDPRRPGTSINQGR